MLKFGPVQAVEAAAPPVVQRSICTTLQCTQATTSDEHEAILHICEMGPVRVGGVGVGV